MREKGRPDSPQSEENKERFTSQEKEPTQKSILQNDSRGSGANILPPDTVKEQAEETDLKELFEDLYFGLWKCMKIYRDEISAGPIEEAADDLR